MSREETARPDATTADDVALGLWGLVHGLVSLELAGLVPGDDAERAAHAHGRRVALVGRSMVRNMGIAADLGYLDVPPGVLIDLKKAD